MRTVPINNGPFLEWVNLVAPAWVEHAQAIGVKVSDAQAFAADAQRVEQLNMQMIQARNAARTATLAYKQAQRALRASAAGIVKQVRLKADEASTPDEAIRITGLARVGIAPQSGPELPPPSAPDEISIALGATMGNVTLKLKARQPVNARGTVYQVTREARIAGGQVRRDILGVATTKTFTDTTIPAGTVEARYLLTALRAGKTGGTREAVVRLAA